MADGTAKRLEALKQAEVTRNYEAARHEAGFDDDSDYKHWLELEEIRKLTFAARAAERKAKQPPAEAVGGTIYKVKPSSWITYNTTV